MNGNAGRERVANKHKDTGRKPGRARKAKHNDSPVGRRVAPAGHRWPRHQGASHDVARRQSQLAPKLGSITTNFRVMIHNMRKKVDLDEFDRRLIEEARRDNLQPARILADKVGLSVSAVLRRMRRLRDMRVIVADQAIIDPALTGSAVTMHVLVKMKQAGASTMDAFARTISRHREVTAAWDVTGDDDFVLKVQVGSMQEYDRFTRRALSEEQGVYAFKTLITIRTIVEDDASRRPLLLD